MATNLPLASASMVSTTLPSSRTSTRSFGAVLPAITVCPSASTLTMSKLGARRSARGPSGGVGSPAAVPG
jgi:hypothetical protein